jgi:putative IMPACT (imprinted ancient) family translation regulator
VVVRYYGGIKLGTGGLVRAYGNGVQLALASLPIKQKVPQAEFLLQCDYGQIAMIETLLQQVGGSILQSEYGAAVDIRLSLPAYEAAEIVNRLYNLSRGSLLLQPV